MWKRIIAIFVFTLAGTMFSVAGDKATRVNYTNPIVKKSLPDPSLIQAKDGYYYLYATEDTRNLPIYRSQNLVDWLFVGTAFTEATRPANLRPFVDEKGVHRTPAIWAPNINYFDGKYVLYYARGVWGGEMHSAICVATSERPEGPFVDQGVCISGWETGICNTIDPFFIEEGGKRYMIWGANCGAIRKVELTSDGMRMLPGAEIKMLANYGCMEGAYVLKKNGYYYLFGSNGGCCDGAESTYHMICGRSKSLDGPFVTETGKRLLDTQYDRLLESDDYCAGPGHNARFVVDDNGTTWIIYHGYLREHVDYGRCLWLDKVIWTANGWPRIGAHKGNEITGHPTRTAQVPYFKRLQK